MNKEGGEIMKKQKGFTLVELLVVIAIIGLLSTLAVVSLNNARARSRDAKRVSDIKQVQTALEMYFNDWNAYPETGALNFASTTPNNILKSPDGTVTYMQQVPAAQAPGTYVYTATTTTSYGIVYTLENATGGLTPGVHTATPGGIANP